MDVRMSKFWESYMIVFPPGEDGDKLQEFLKGLGFVDSDWCEMWRDDGGHMYYGPVEPGTDLAEAIANNIQDRALLMRPDMQESLAQMRRGEGIEVDPESLRAALEDVEKRRFNPNACA